MVCLICWRDSMAFLLLHIQLSMIVREYRVVSETHLFRLQSFSFDSYLSVFSLALVYNWLLSEMIDWKVLKLPPERVEALCCLCISLISDSYLLNVESFLFCRLYGLLLSFLPLPFYIGWLSFLNLFCLSPKGKSLTRFLNVLCEQLSLKVVLRPWVTR